MDCIESRILIDECVHGSLDHEQAARLDDHLNGCAECAQDLKELTRVRDLLAGARELDPPAGLLDHVWDQVTAELDAPPDAPVIPRNRRMNAMPYVLEAGRAAPAAAARRRTLTLVAAGLTAAALVIVAYAIGMQTMSPRLTAMDAEAPGRQSAAGYAMPPLPGSLCIATTRKRSRSPQTRRRLTGRKTWAAVGPRVNLNRAKPAT
ncbi:MAG: zf-HC2 domain-containing protein [Planctomycetota bacterium]|nr:zf-HC2 domain-containing protein [Planctomycetota bacterium]